MNLVLLRHTRPAEATGRCYGALDMPLAPDFEADANAALGAVAPPERILSSPLHRCRALADLAVERFGVPVSVDPRLAEMDFGRWEGRMWVDIPREEIDLWAADILTARPHGGETVADLVSRVRAALRDCGGGRALVVTHAGVIRAAAHLSGERDPWSLSVPYGTTWRWPSFARADL
ncbi:MAG: alpha-ribazole phosphatase family protein [Pseudomonadota bacterium]